MNHLAEVLTGEGKCLTLGILAAFLAKMRIPCDIVCLPQRWGLVQQRALGWLSSDRQVGCCWKLASTRCYNGFLVEQDQCFMKPFHDFVGVSSSVRYLTFDELCRRRLGVIEKGARTLVERGPLGSVQDSAA